MVSLQPLRDLGLLVKFFESWGCEKNIKINFGNNKKVFTFAAA